MEWNNDDLMEQVNDIPAPLPDTDIATMTAEQQLAYGDKPDPWVADLLGEASNQQTSIDDVMDSKGNLRPGETPSDMIEAKPHTGKAIHDYGKGMYNSYTKKKGSKATRNNNPGNITGMGGSLLYGAVGFAHSKVGDVGDHTQLIYDTPEKGFAAMHNLAMKKYSSGSIKTSFKKWQSSMKSFNNKLKDLKRVGININDKYTNLSAGDQKLFRKVWSQHEGYRGTYY